MVWNIVFWAAIAYIALVILWQLFTAATGRARRAEREGTRRSFISRVWRLSRYGLVVLIVGFVVKEGLFSDHGLNWSAVGEEEVRHFSKSMSYYEEASALRDRDHLTDEDWETVRALLSAALYEAEQVSDSVLEKIHSELKERFRDQYAPGLRCGIFVLRYQKTKERKKASDVTEEEYDDSLTTSYSNLSIWGNWYAANYAAVAEATELEEEE